MAQISIDKDRLLALVTRCLEYDTESTAYRSLAGFIAEKKSTGYTSSEFAEAFISEKTMIEPQIRQRYADAIQAIREEIGLDAALEALLDG